MSSSGVTHHDNMSIGGTLAVTGAVTLTGAQTFTGAASFSSTITQGSDGTGHDATFYGDTAGSYLQWDADTTSLLIPGTAAKFKLGTFSGSTSGSGSVLSSSSTAALRVYTDDGGAAIGSGQFVRAGVFRNLQTYTSGNREQEAAGVVGQVVSVAGTNRHNMCGVMGSYEARTSLTVDGQAAATDTWCQAGVIGRVGMSSGTLTLNSNGVLAGVAAMSNINTAVTQTYTGDYCAFYAGAWASTDDWEHGLLIESGKCTTGVTIKTTSGAGIDFPSGETYDAALRFGTFSTPVVYSSDEQFEIHGRLGNATSQKPLIRVRNSAPASTAMTTGAVIGIQAQAYGTDTSNVGALEALEAHVGIKANCTIIADTGTMPNMRAGWFKIEDLGFDLTLTGDAAALCLGWQFNSGTTLTGNADWMFLAKEGSLTDPADAFVRVYDGAGGGWATNLFDIPASLPYDAANSSGSQSGKIAIKVGGATKYIQCYSD